MSGSDLNSRITAKSLVDGAYFTWPNSRRTSKCRVADSPGFDTKFVVYRYSQTLLAANIAFSGLNRDMSKEKLDLFKFASGIMTEPRTGPPEIMWREVWNVHGRGSLLDNVPNRLF